MTRLLSRRNCLALTGALALGTGRALAHDPNLAAFLLEQTPGGWILEIHGASAGIAAVLKSELGPAWERTSAIEYRRHLADYLRQNVRLFFDGEFVPLGEIGMKLGSHESRLRCPLAYSGPPPRIIRAELVAFSHVGHQHNLLRLKLPGGSARLMANRDNHFTVEWSRDEATEVESKPRSISGTLPHPNQHQPTKKSDSRASRLGLVSAGLLGIVGLGLTFKR